MRLHQLANDPEMRAIFKRVEKDAMDKLSSLTDREREVLDLVLEGLPNKIIAHNLGISSRSIENHRASIMKKTGTKNIIALLRITLIAG